MFYKYLLDHFYEWVTEGEKEWMKLSIKWPNEICIWAIRLSGLDGKCSRKFLSSHISFK